ncbi:UDP-glucose--hexose-1-phosphate uridylyltransferase [Methylocystis heyeri]|uniref:Galactose-1-phosphate uridylyltransferase n=1 Tax=Methylocystis heyeri TaxID=391905 RepID=A0A6B8KBK7_9HYPH|nr:UDP-glucose--hexose-1-phosphate uridylyltransferase [Methylocystis heyeri]QGM44411.1 UDP-glucose--hexose-1-phosphate uridylyltransferase [Methylocystis heyeri]
MSFLQESPHRRFNPLSGDWVLVSPHRTKRPWSGQIEPAAGASAPSHDPGCYLCPGAVRANGAQNPAYESVFVFDNDFAALQPHVTVEAIDIGGLLTARTEQGRCRVICFSPRHDLWLARMDAKDIAEVVEAWRREFVDLGARDDVNYVQIFENRGPMMGASNPHPHCQIWASASVPNEPAREDRFQADYLKRNSRCLLCDYLAKETQARERIVCENDSFVAVAPFWAVWPFELLLLSKRHLGAIDQFTEPEKRDLAAMLKSVCVRYDNLFQTPFPYTMGFHQRPTDGGDYPHWHFHGHFYPPLLRSASIRKFMVGFELLASPQRDITPEAAAERLRACSERHYLER